VLRYLNVIAQPAQAVNILFSCIYTYGVEKYKSITLLCTN
jgi:hypothetical protein